MPAQPFSVRLDPDELARQDLATAGGRDFSRRAAPPVPSPLPGIFPNLAKRIAGSIGAQPEAFGRGAGDTGRGAAPPPDA